MCKLLYLIVLDFVWTIVLLYACLFSDAEWTRGDVYLFLISIMLMTYVGHVMFRDWRSEN